MSTFFKTAALAVALSISLGASANALQTPSTARGDSRVRFIDYHPYDVTKIVGTLRSVVQIEFSPDEEIAHAPIGDSIAWEVAPEGNILFLKAREKHPLTNLQVVTTRRDGSKRSYQLELTTREGDLTPASGTYFLVKYRYPADEADRRRREGNAKRSAQQARHADETLKLHAQYGPRNWRYAAQGAASIEPKSVYDNGKTTTFAFAGNAEIPAIYIENADGTESLVPKSTEGNLVTVHAISKKFILRRGKSALCVFNEAYSPTGINPGTGTTSPSVERVVAGEQ